MTDEEFKEFFGVEPGEPKTLGQFAKELKTLVHDNAELINKVKKENK